jgi:hypothetical protein
MQGNVAQGEPGKSSDVAAKGVLIERSILLPPIGEARLKDTALGVTAQRAVDATETELVGPRAPPKWRYEAEAEA